MNLAALNSFDYVVLAIILISVLFGFVKGFVRSVLSLVGWLAAGYIAYVGFPIVKPFLLTQFSNELVVNVGGPVALYFAALITVSLVSYQITALLGGICGGMVDRSMGFAFGFLRGALIVTVGFIGLTMVAPGMSADKRQDNYQAQAAATEKLAPEWLKNAQTYNLLRLSSAMLVTSVPSDMMNTAHGLLGEKKKATASQEVFVHAMKVAGQMQGLLPKEANLSSVDIASLEFAPTEAADKKRKEVFRLILETYKTSLKSGKISADQALSEEDIKRLEGAIAIPYVPPTAVTVEKLNKEIVPGAGYDKKQINELDRLIQTVQ